ncbi:MAG: cupin domain-containing protein [Acidimicrobiales bacterium]
MNKLTEQTTPETELVQPYVLARDEGRKGHFLNNLVTEKVTAAHGGSVVAVEANAPQGFGPPLHSHDNEDEIIVVLDGEVRFECGGDVKTVGAGGLAYFPHGHPHTFQVLSESSRMLNITASAAVTPIFDDFVDALSTPTDSVDLPPQTEIDGGRVAEVGARHGIQVLGPPPAPLG